MAEQDVIVRRLSSIENFGSMNVPLDGALWLLHNELKQYHLRDFLDGLAFAYKHVDYQDELWWRFEFSRDAPRSLRAIAGVAIVTMIALSARELPQRQKSTQWFSPSPNSSTTGTVVFLASRITVSVTRSLAL